MLGELAQMEDIQEQDKVAEKYPGGRSFLNMVHQFEVSYQDHEDTHNQEFKLKGYAPADGKGVPDFLPLPGQFTHEDAEEYRILG